MIRFGINRNEVEAIVSKLMSRDRSINPEKGDFEYLKEEGSCEGLEDLASKLRTDLSEGLNGLDELSTHFRERRERFGDNSGPTKDLKPIIHIFASVFLRKLLGVDVAIALCTLTFHFGIQALMWLQGYNCVGLFFTEWISITIIILFLAFTSSIASIRLRSKLKQENELSQQQNLFDVTVIRNGSPQRIPVNEILTGDIIELRTGDKIPADGVIIRSHDLTTNEVSLTGDIHPNQKSMDGNILVLSSTEVFDGGGRMMALTVGKSTEWRKMMFDGAEEEEIQPQPQQDEDDEDDSDIDELEISTTPVQLKLEKLSTRICYFVVFVIIILVILSVLVLAISKFIFGTWTTRVTRDQSCYQYFPKNDGKISSRLSYYLPFQNKCASVTDDFIKLGMILMIVSTLLLLSIPRGLPHLYVKYSLGMNVNKLLKDQVLVRNLKSVEKIGQIDTLICEKTGTITTNQMRVSKAWVSGHEFLDDRNDVYENYASLMPSKIRNLITEGISVNSTANLVHQNGEMAIYNPSIPIDEQFVVEGNKIEGALLFFCEENMKTPYLPIRNKVEDNSLFIKKMPFSSIRKRSSVIIEKKLSMKKLNFSYSSNPPDESESQHHQEEEQEEQKKDENEEMKKKSTSSESESPTKSPKEESHLKKKKKQKNVVVGGEDDTLCIHRMYSKGSAEKILEISNRMMNAEGEIVSIDNSREVIKTLIRSFNERGLRTIAFAFKDEVKKSPNIIHNDQKDDEQEDIRIEEEEGEDDEEDGNKEKKEEEDFEKDMILYLIVGIRDFIRRDVMSSIQECYRNGICVRMISGDTKSTSKYLSEELGLYDETQGHLILDGEEFRSCTDRELYPKLSQLRVLARARPDDKKRFVKLLMEIGHCVGVTGSSTSDAPALNSSDVGLAMGISGTEVCRAASDLVILDDSFSTIVKCVMSGRKIVGSVKKIVQFHVTMYFSALLFFGLICLINQFVPSPMLFYKRNGSSEDENDDNYYDTNVEVMSFTSPMTVLQIFYVNFVVMVISSQALMSEKQQQRQQSTENKRRLFQNRRRKLNRLMDGNMWISVFSQVTYQVIVLLFLYYLNVIFSPSFIYTKICERNTMVFNTFVFLQIFNALNCRRLHFLEWNVCSDLLLIKNVQYMIRIVFVIINQIMFTQCGMVIVFRMMTGTTGLTLVQWIISIGLAVSCILVHVLKNLVLRLLYKTICKPKKRDTEFQYDLVGSHKMTGSDDDEDDKNLEEEEQEIIVVQPGVHVLGDDDDEV